MAFRNPHAFSAAAALLALCGTAGAQVKTGALYHDPQYGFAAEPPEHSKVYFISEAGGNVGFDAHRDGDVFYVHAQPAPAQGATPAAFADMQRRALKQMCVKSSTVSEEEVQVGGLPGTELRADCNNGGSDSFSDRRVAVVRFTMREVENVGLVVYTLGMVTTPEHERRNPGRYTGMAESFSLKEPGGSPADDAPAGDFGPR